MGLLSNIKASSKVDPEKYRPLEYIVTFFVILGTVLVTLFLLVKTVEFLHVLRRECSKAHYRLFLCLSTAFLLLLAYVVADFVGPQISKEAKNRVVSATVLILVVFFWMYQTCIFVDRSQVRPKAPEKAPEIVGSKLAAGEQLDVDPPKYGDLYPPSYSAAIRGDHSPV